MSMQFSLMAKKIPVRTGLSFVHKGPYSQTQRYLSQWQTSYGEGNQRHLSQRQPWQTEPSRRHLGQSHSPLRLPWNQKPSLMNDQLACVRPDMAGRRSLNNTFVQSSRHPTELRHASLSSSKRTYAESKSTNGVIRSDYWIDDLPRTDFVSFLFNRFEKWPNNIAIECDDSGRHYTYSQLMEYSLRWGSALTRLGDGTAPECVAVLSPNVPEFFIAMFGAMAVGSYVTTVPTLATPAEVAHHLDDSGAKVVVVDASLVDKAQAAVQLTTSGRRVTLVTNGKSDQNLLNLTDLISDDRIERVQRVENSPDKVALMLYSSGTTGPPKGVCLPHRAVSGYLPTVTHGDFFPFAEAQPGKQETSLGLMPFYHSFGLMVIAATSFYLGHRVVCHPHPNPMKYAELVAKYKPVGLHLVPPLLNFLTQSPHVTPAHLASVRAVLIASAPVHPAIAKAFKQKAPQEIKFQEGLGLTETLPLMLTPLSDERLGFCGKLMPNIEARVEHPSSRELLGPGQPGELVVRGPCFFSHYHNNPKATAEAYSADGWFRTGDVVTYNEDHFFSVVDRVKELIKVKAYQVSPTELENLILQLDDVAEVGVVGVPDERAGELPRAYVVLKEGQRNAQMMEQVLEKINNHIKEKAAPYKKLTGGIFFVKELPKNPTGKLLRRQLKAQALSESKA